jgi:hypothetical protein
VVGILPLLVTLRGQVTTGRPYVRFHIYSPLSFLVLRKPTNQPSLSNSTSLSYAVIPRCGSPFYSIYYSVFYIPITVPVTWCQCFLSLANSLQLNSSSLLLLQYNLILIVFFFRNLFLFSLIIFLFSYFLIFLFLLP